MRNLVLDGIRGWAALAVVLFHFIEEPLKGMTTLVTDSWFFFLLDGTFYVCVFFVVSGQALSASFMRTGDLRAVDALLVKRYARLTIPIVMSCTLVYIVLALNIDYHKQATEALHNQIWMGRFMSQLNENFLSIVKYSLIDVYTKHIPAASPNPFLWTMSVEMVGSLLVFCVCYIWHRLERPFETLVAVSLLLLCLGTFYSLFLAGAAISASANKQAPIVNDSSAARATLRMASLFTPLGALGLIHLLRDFTIPVSVYCGLAILSVLALQHHPFYRRAMTNSLSLYLGKISFPLYVVHFAVLISPTSFLWSQSAMSSFAANELQGQLLIGLLGAAICIPIASLFLKLEKLITPRVEAALLAATLSNQARTQSQ